MLEQLSLSWLQQVADLPINWALCAVAADKRPYHPDNQKGQGWQLSGLDRSRFVRLNGHFAAVGLLTGPLSGGLVAIDHDGHSADEKIEELSGATVTEALPITVGFTSQRDGRYQLLYSIPEELWSAVKTRKYPTGTKAADSGKGEALEFRWAGAQSVILGAHPTTAGYRWLDRRSPWEVEVAPAPDWIIMAMRDETPEHVAIARTEWQMERPLETPIPLINLATKKHRQHINEGVGEGSRNDAGAAIARDLIGCEQWAISSNVYFDGNAKALFWQFAQRSGLSESEAKTIWRSAERGTPHPACSDEGLQSVLKSWERKNGSKMTQKKAEGNGGVGVPPVDESHLSTEDFKNHFESSLTNGLIYVQWGIDKKTGLVERSEVRVGEHLCALAFVDSPTKDDAQIYIEFQARQEMRTLTMKRSDLAGEGTDVIKLLNEHSYYHSRKHKALLLDYLNNLGKNCEINYVVTQRTGWIKDSFVLPDRSFGDTMIRFQQVDKPINPVFEEIGTLDEWKENIASLCVGNSRLTFAIGVSFAAPLAALLSIESGGYHFYGSTSTGKTSALWVAASVYGQEKQNVFPWRTTSNALEYKAAARNNLALLLDEIGQATAQDVAQSAYLLANGQGKSRMRKDLTMRDNLKWNLTFLSNGEHTLSSYLEKGGIETKGGQENRMPSIPAVVKNGFGAFESCHGMAPAEFSATIKRRSQKYCGTAFTAFMTQLVEEKSKEGFEADLFARHAVLRKALTALAPYNEVLERVADRMACVQVGLELAIEYGILPHSYDSARWSVQTIFCDWVNDRGGAVNFELKQTLDKIEHLLITQEHGDRILDLNRNDMRSDQVVRNLLAYKRGDEFFVPPAVFEKEFVGELSRNTLIEALIKRGWMTPGADGKTAQSRNVLSKKQRVYVFNKFWTDGDQS